MENNTIPSGSPIIKGALNVLRGAKVHLKLDPSSSAVSSVRLLKNLAEGGSCFVYLVETVSGDKRKKRTKKRMALKVTPLHTQHKYCQSLKEASLLLQLSHKNIVNFHGASLAQQHHSRSTMMAPIHLLLVEYCMGGNLFDAIATMRMPYSAFTPRPMSTSKYAGMLLQRARSPFSLSNDKNTDRRNESLHINLHHLRRITTILQQVSSALSYLHSQSIIYFDIKLENILLVDPLDLRSFCCVKGLKDETIKVKLCDLGSAHQGASIPIITSKQRQMTADMISKSTTPLYKPPECVDFFSYRSIDQKVDVWSFGCVTYQLLFYQHVWEDYFGAPLSVTASPKIATRKTSRLGFKMSQTPNRAALSKSRLRNITSTVTATMPTQTPNLAILSGRYHLPPLHSMVPLVLPRIDDGRLFHLYMELVQMIKQEMLALQPSERSSIDMIHKELERLSFELTTESGINESASLLETPMKISKLASTSLTVSSHRMTKNNEIMTAVPENDDLTLWKASCGSFDEIIQVNSLTTNFDKAGSPTNSCFALQSWVADAAASRTTENSPSTAHSSIRSEASFSSERYHTNVEVVSVNCTNTRNSRIRIEVE